LQNLDFISDSFHVWTFSFGDSFDTEKLEEITVRITNSGTVNAVVFYWEMNLWNDISLSTEPKSEPNSWNQAIQFLPGQYVESQETIKLQCSHSDTRITFKWPS